MRWLEDFSVCRYIFILWGATLTLGFAPAPVFKPKPDPSAIDLARLQGSWMAAGGLEARIEKDRLTYYRDGKLVTGYRITVNATTDPKSLDLVGVAGGAIDGRTYLAIYSLGPDSLTTCSNGWKEPRPAAFTGPKVGQFVEAYQRKKR
jgi:uncharacterized protein (TIGR03067 family)